jgi:hypothetical protein
MAALRETATCRPQDVLKGDQPVIGLWDSDRIWAGGFQTSGATRRPFQIASQTVLAARTKAIGWWIETESSLSSGDPRFPPGVATTPSPPPVSAPRPSDS